MFVKLQSCRELTSLRICRRDKAKGSRKCNALLLCARLPSFPLSSIFQVEQPNVSCFNVKRKKQDVQNDKKKKKKRKKRKANDRTSSISRRAFRCTRNFGVRRFEDARLKSYDKNHFAARCFLNVSPIIPTLPRDSVYIAVRTTRVTSSSE